MIFSKEGGITLPETQLLSNPHRLSGFGLKRLAVASMVVDHIGSIIMNGLLSPYWQGGYLQLSADMPFLVRHGFQIKAVCEVLGSIGFPLFCFLLSEGFLHTRNRLRYALILGAFALLSEIPFDLAHYQAFWNPTLQNVLFTLCTAAFTLWGISAVETRWKGPPLGLVGLRVAVTAAGMAVALLLRGEYVFLGILAVVLFYLLRDYRWFRLLGLAPLLVVSPWVLLALAPLVLYGETRGQGLKWFFYFFYPSHFLLFAVVAWFLSQLPAA